MYRPRRRDAHRVPRAEALLALLLMLAGGTAGAAQPWEGPSFSAPAGELLRAASAAQAQGGASVVVVYDDRHVAFDAQGRATSTMHYVYRVDTAAGVEDWGDVSYAWEAWYGARPVIRARVVTADGVEHALDPKLLTDTATRSDTPLIYSDSRNYAGPLPAVAVGCVVEVEIVTTDTSPYFATGAVYAQSFGKSVPVLHTRLTVDAPSSLPLRHALSLLPSSDLREVRTAERTGFVVEHGEMPAREPTGQWLPPELAYQPEVTYSTGESWAAIARGYAQLSEPVISAADAAGLVRGIDVTRPRAQVIAALVERLHREVRYTGIEFGESRLVPHRPAQTLAQGFGDCKDKSVVLVAALRAAGIPAGLALLRTGPGWDVDPALPGMGLFDHAIVYVPGPEPLWIDATAQYERVGDLPWEDRGRQALLIDEATVALVPTPEARPEQNRVVETREFTLSEFGKSRVVETTHPQGDDEADYRSNYGGAKTDEVRKQLEEYAKAHYAADALAGYEAHAATDFARPFELRLDVRGAWRGTTRINDATVWIPLGSLYSRLPSALRKADAGQKKPATPRTADWVFRPFVTEWRYRIMLPPGFVAAALPTGGTTAVGPATLTEEFATESDGVVTATLRFDTVRGRYTMAEVSALRAKLAEIAAAPTLALRFEPRARQQLAAGDLKGVLEEYGKLAALHPKEALHRVQIAEALLDAGLGARARAQARAATELEPRSALAWATYGWIQEHDAIGRRFGTGFDLAGAASAYRRAMALEPTDTEYPASLAILLEHDSAGVRYSPRANLAEAVRLYQARAKLLAEDDEDSLRVNLLLAMYYAGQYPQLGLMVDRPGTDTERALSIALAAIGDGTAAGVARAETLAKSTSDRSARLAEAAQYLVRARRYALAVGLLEAVRGAGAPSSEQLDILRASRRLEELSFPPEDPRGVVTKLLVALATTPAGAPMAIEDYYSQLLLSQLTPAKRRSVGLLGQGVFIGTLRTQSDLPVEVTMDVAFTSGTFTYEGDAAGGYRVRAKLKTGQSLDFYVVQESSGPRVLGFSEEPRSLGLAALERLRAGDLAAARAWLDRARDHLRSQAGEDPLALPAFPHLWRKGQDGDAVAIEAAAVALLGADPGPDAAHGVASLEQALERSGDATEKGYIRLALIQALTGTRNWARAAAVAEALVAEHPDSETAFMMLTTAEREAGRMDVLLAAARSRRERLPHDAMAAVALAVGAIDEQRYADVPALLRPSIQGEGIEARDYNNFAWFSLLAPPVGAEALEAARAAYGAGQGKSYASAHTLACVLAAMHRPKEAHDVLIKAMKDAGVERPTDTVWFASGMIAEAWGDPSGARDYYARVEAPADPATALDPTSSYAMAKRRLAALAQAEPAAPR